MNTESVRAIVFDDLGTSCAVGLQDGCVDVFRFTEGRTLWATSSLVDGRLKLTKYGSVRSMTFSSATDNFPSRLIVSTSDANIHVFDCIYDGDLIFKDERIVRLVPRQRFELPQSYLSSRRFPIKHCYSGAGGGYHRYSKQTLQVEHSVQT